jgi:hypothetical protein
MTNDPQKENTELLITGMVDKLLTIKPKYIRLRGSPDQPVVAKVLIIPEPKYLFSIVNATAEEGSNIEFFYKAVKTDNGKDGYALTVRNKSIKKGHYMDAIILKTTSIYKPEIKLIVFGTIG